jgi:YhcH/YjgK/YiaL family protein
MTPCYTLLFALFFFLMTACKSDKPTEDPENWSEAEAAEWFDQREWLQEKELKPHPSIDKKEFAIHYHRDPQRWNKAFSFLAKKDLASTETGTHEVDGENAYAIVSEYNTKNPEDADFESHKKYTDVQFIISGAEHIGLTDLSSTSPKIPYNEEKDIAFYNAENRELLVAEPGTFFIFFPDDAHRPGMKIDENLPVKKVVIKVRN